MRVYTYDLQIVEINQDLIGRENKEKFGARNSPWLFPESRFKFGSGNHQRGIFLLQKFSDILDNMRLVPFKMTSPLTSDNFQILKTELFFKLCKI